jgi:hypothetical protein
MEIAKGIPTNVRVNKDEIIQRIKASVKQDGFVYGRLMLGILMENEDNCKGTGDKLIKEIKDELGEEDFKVLVEFLKACLRNIHSNDDSTQVQGSSRLYFIFFRYAAYVVFICRSCAVVSHLQFMYKSSE